MFLDISTKLHHFIIVLQFIFHIQYKLRKTPFHFVKLHTYFIICKFRPNIGFNRNQDHTTNDNSTTTTQQATTQRNVNSTKFNLKVRQFNKTTIQQNDNSTKRQFNKATIQQTTHKQMQQFVKRQFNKLKIMLLLIAIAQNQCNNLITCHLLETSFIYCLECK